MMSRACRIVRHTIPVSGQAVASIALTVMLTLSVLSCHDLTGSQSLPSGTQDPSYYNTATGALEMRNSAVHYFGEMLPNYLVTTGMLADELTDPTTGSVSAGNAIANGGQIQNPLDERILPALSYGSTGSYTSDATYAQLQGVRASALQAIGQLTAYDTSAKDSLILKPSVDRVLRGELYALYGFTEIMLADFFCSGIPLTTLDFQKDFTYHAGSPRDSVYLDAIAKLDTAFVLSADSIRIQNLVRVGLGRAYLDLGKSAAAADDVASVPSEYVYQQSGKFNAFNTAYQYTVNVINIAGLLSDREGTNGLPFISSQDPRTADTTIEIGSATLHSVLYPQKYVAGLTGTFYAPITVASGVEARLIQAEADLRSGNVTTWLNTLNALRTSGSVTMPPDTIADTLGITGCGNGTICGTAPGGSADAMGEPPGGFPVPAAYHFAYRYTITPVSAVDSAYCWNNSWYTPCYNKDSLPVLVYVSSVRTEQQAGSGGVNDLTVLTDPGVGSANSDSARVALTFQERAYWLYLTGHRQGDLRRQLRQYPQYWRAGQRAVYPSGVYLGLGAGIYGTDVTAPIPPTEYLNPLFHGCLDRAP